MFTAPLRINITPNRPKLSTPSFGGANRDLITALA